MIILSSFLVTFVIVRAITHAIRAGRWRRVLRNLQTAGGTHLHHLVIGIVLLLTAGYLSIGPRNGPSPHMLAVMFGIGAALTLDEARSGCTWRMSTGRRKGGRVSTR